MNGQSGFDGTTPGIHGGQRPPQSENNNEERVVAATVAGLLIAAGAAGVYGLKNTDGGAGQRAKPPIAVGMAKVATEDLPIELSATGNVTAIEKWK